MKNKHCFLACSLTWSLSHAQLALIQPRPTCLRILPPSVESLPKISSTLSLTDIATSHSDEGTPSIEVPYYVCSSEMLRTEDNYDMETIINEEIVKAQNQCANHINYRTPATTSGSWSSVWARIKWEGLLAQSMEGYSGMRSSEALLLWCEVSLTPRSLASATKEVAKAAGRWTEKHIAPQAYN